MHALGRGRQPAPRSWPARWWSSPTAAPSQFKPLYPDDMPLCEKINTIATRIYRAADDRRQASVRRPASRTWRQAGYGNLPVCMAKTQYSFSTDPEPARRADRPHRAGARGQALGRRRLRRRHLRRDHDHARPAEGARRRKRSASTRRARSKACSDQSYNSSLIISAPPGFARRGFFVCRRVSLKEWPNNSDEIGTRAIPQPLVLRTRSKRVRSLKQRQRFHERFRKYCLAAGADHRAPLDRHRGHLRPLPPPQSPRGATVGRS